MSLSTRKKATLSLTLIALILVVSLAASTVAVYARPDRQVSVLVGFKGAEDATEITKRGGQVKYSYQYVQAVAASIPASQVDALKKDSDVAYVEEDIQVHVLAETLPWGISKIEAPTVWNGGDKGTGIKVAVLDTGIDLSHPDLHVVGGTTFVPGTTSYNDDHGHGTHCAGIIAALDNDIGVVGVAPEASLYAVKVLDSKGSGYLSSIVSGIEWCISNGIQVISMSFGSKSAPDVFMDEFTKAYNSGIVMVAAAGNSGPRSNTVNFPANLPSVIAVAATDSNDVVASFSSRGSQLSVAAPGVSIYSTYFGSRYAYMSGTSMACPHAAGTAALLLESALYTPAQVKTVLQNTAVDLGPAGKDTSSGYGRINAAFAVGASQPTPDFSIAASPSSLTVAAGASGSSTITVASLNTFSGTVNLSTSAPSGWTATVTPASQSLASGGTASSTLSVSVPAGASSGSYSVVVTGTSGSITHSTMVTVNAPAPATVPSDPRNLKATPGNAQVSLSWSAPSSNGVSAIQNYRVYRHTASTAEALLATVGNVLSYTDNTVANGETYHYRITAVNGVGESPFSSEVSATPSVTQIKTMTVNLQINAESSARATNVLMTVRVSDGVTGAKLSGASVAVTIQTPNGSVSAGTGTTDSNGRVRLAYSLGKTPALGTYTVTATISLTEYQSSTVQKAFNIR